VFIFFYTQQVITIQPENKTVRSVPPRVGRSVREPPQDGSEYKAIRLIAVRSVVRCAESASLIHAFTRWEVLSPAAFGRNNGFRGCQRTPLARELLAKKISCAGRPLPIGPKPVICDLVKLRVRDVCHGSAAARTVFMQQKTRRPVQFEITEQTRESLSAWIRSAGRHSNEYLFPSRIHGSPHLCTRHMRELFAAGFEKSVWTRAHTALTRCGALRPP
jgi:hypothetical protein